MNGLKITKASARRGKGSYGYQARNDPYVYRQSLARGRGYETLQHFRSAFAYALRQIPVPG